MASNKFDTQFVTIYARDLKLTYSTDWGDIKVEGSIQQVMNHLMSLNYKQ